MERAVKFWGSLAGALVASLTIGTFISKSVAAAEVRPIESRVTTLEAQRVSDREKLDEIAKDVKTLLYRVPERRH